MTLVCVAQDTVEILLTCVSLSVGKPVSQIIFTLNLFDFYYAQISWNSWQNFDKNEKSFNLALFLGVSLPCSAGYICLQGSDIPNPADNVKGFICPVGHYCLEGAVKETKCDIGTYGPTEGLGKGLWWCKWLDGNIKCLGNWKHGQTWVTGKFKVS